MYYLGLRSRMRMRGLHPDLVRVVKRAIQITDIDFTVLEGLRNRNRQTQLVKAGASMTMNSRHLTGHAIDLGALLNGKVRWDWNLYHKIAEAMKQAAKELNIELEWGGDWQNFPDGAHFQLPWANYPKEQKIWV